MSEFRLQPIGDDNAWDDFVKRSPQGNPFMLSAMLKASAATVERWGYFEDGAWLAAAPFFRDDANEIVPPGPFMLYQGMTLAKSTEVKPGSRASRNFKITENFLGELVQRYSRIEFHQHPAFEDLRPFQWLNYHAPERGQFVQRLLYTGILDLTPYPSFDAYLQSVRTLRKREFKRALGVCRYVESNDVGGLVELHDKTYGRQGIALSDELRRYRERIVTAGLDNGTGRLCQAVTANGVASMIYFLQLGDTAYYLFGANDPAQRDSGASSGLMLHMIANAMASGARWIDFCGINSPTRGDYKISLGAAPRPYFLLSYRQQG